MEPIDLAMRRTLRSAQRVPMRQRAAEIHADHHRDDVDRGASTRLVASWRTLGWLCTAALAAVIASERMYWYWAGIDIESLGVLSVYYAVAIAVAFTVLASSPGTGPRRAVLGGAVFALVAEGIITPVVYEDGPLPLLFLMFVGWHGVVAFVGLVYLVRRWALDGRWRRLAAASVTVGVGWGVWALSSAVSDGETGAEFVAEGGSAALLSPREFAIYASWTGLALVLAHVALDRLWPAPGWRPSRIGIASTAAASVLLLALHVVPSVPWAPVKLVAIGGVLALLLRRTASSPGRPTLIDELAGSARLRLLAPLALLPMAAAGTYAVLWSQRESTVMEPIFFAAIAAQVVVGVVALSVAARRSRV